MNELFNEMQSKGLVSFGGWLQRAIEQKNPHLTVALAHSKILPLIQDELDKMLGTVETIKNNREALR